MEDQRSYEAREKRDFFNRLRDLEKDGDRKAGYVELVEVIKQKTGKRFLIDQVFGWLMNGSFGFGSYKAFEEIEAKDRVKVIMGFIWACKLNFYTSEYYVRKALKESGWNLEKLNGELIKEMKEYQENSKN